MAYISRTCHLIIACLVMLGIRFYVMGFSAPRFTKVDNPASFHPNLIVRVSTFAMIREDRLRGCDSARFTRQ